MTLNGAVRRRKKSPGNKIQGTVYSFLGKLFLYGPVKNIPGEYLSDFIEEQLILLKSRIKLTIFLFLPAFVFGTGLVELLDYKKIHREFFLTWGLLAAACAVFLFIVNKVKTVNASRLLALTMSIVLLALIGRNDILTNSPFFFSIITYIIMFFGLALIVPWTQTDIAALGLIHTAVFTWTFYGTSEQLLDGMVINVAVDDYLQGVIILAVICFIGIAATRHENESRINSFLLRKEVEKKNKQMEKELEFATQVHATLIPKSLNNDLVDISVMYLPMEYVGGDYAKFHFVDEKKLIFIICDVTGHGVSAALLVNRLHAEFERCAREAKEPGYLLNELDKFISRDFGEINMYLSAFCGLLDFRHRKFIYSNHGHPPQYMYRLTRSFVESLEAQTSLLGLPLNDKNIYQLETSFERGDRIFLFTDGVIETKNKNNDEYGKERVEDFIKRNHALDSTLMNNELVKELGQFKYGPFKDDIFILNFLIK